MREERAGARVDFFTGTSSSLSLESSDEQSDASELPYPHRAPPQSSLTRSPLRVIPYRSQVQEPVETLDKLDGEDREEQSDEDGEELKDEAGEEEESR